MELKHIPIEQLHISTLNMRYGRKNTDVSDILPTVRSRGVIQPILVRPRSCPERVGPEATEVQRCAPADHADGGVEIVAGSRRFHAARIVAE